MSKVATLLKKEKILALLKDRNTEGNAKESVMEAVLTTGIAVGGAQLGKVMGRPSLLWGLSSALAGHYFNSNRLTYLGVGLMAGGVASNGTNGLGATTFTDKLKGSLKDIRDDLKHRLYLDKVLKPAASGGTNGLGNVQYFKYPESVNGGELDMGALNDIEDEISRSSERLQARQMKGYEEEVAGLEEGRIY